MSTFYGAEQLVAIEAYTYSGLSGGVFNYTVPAGRFAEIFVTLGNLINNANFSGSIEILSGSRQIFSQETTSNLAGRTDLRFFVKAGDIFRVTLGTASDSAGFFSKEYLIP